MIPKYLRHICFEKQGSLKEFEDYFKEEQLKAIEKNV